VTLSVSLNPDVVVGVQSISITSVNGTTTRILSDGIKATIDSNTPDMWLPTSVCDELALALGLTYVEVADRYAVTDSARSAIRSSPPKFSFVIGTSATGGSTVSIDIPYGAFDLQAAFPIFSPPAYYFPLRRAANESQFTLGRAFLQEVYLSVDWERSRFNISQAVFSSPPLPQEIVTIEPVDQLGQSNPQDQSSGKTKPLSVGAIVGIAIGSLGLIVLICLGWWSYLHRKKKRKQGRTQTEHQGDSPTDEKQVSGTRSEILFKQNRAARTDLELEGQQIKEIYTPYEHTGRTEYKNVGHFTELVEADSVTPMHELAATVSELPASEEHTRREM